MCVCGTRASPCCGLSRCRAQALDAQAQQPWLTGLAALWHVGSSRTWAQTHVPCISRQILNHCATREAPLFFFWYAGLSLLWPLPLRSTGCGRAGSAAMAHGPSCSAACGIFPDRVTNPCHLHQQADSQPLRHQGSPGSEILTNF